MEKTIVSTGDREYEFFSHKEATDFIVAKNLLNYGISCGDDVFCFLGGKLYYADTKDFIILGNVRYVKRGEI